jgi:multicomponent Na+:H+ antiporter subunit E
MQRVVGSLLAALVLFANWVVLSGKFDAAHLGAGAVTAVVVAVTTWRLWTLPPALGASLVAPLHGIRWWRAIGYACRLAWDVALSAVQIAYVVLHPRMPIAPRLVRVTAALPHTLARLTLANSITLTPGTVTLEVDGNEFLVHALTPGAARGVESGAISDRVSAIFASDRPAPRVGDRG